MEALSVRVLSWTHASEMLLSSCRAVLAQQRQHRYTTSGAEQMRHCANTVKQFLDGIWCSPVNMTLFLPFLVKGCTGFIDLTAKGDKICLGLSWPKLIIS